MTGLSLQGNANVFEHGQVRKYRRDLEGARQPHARDRRRTRARDLLAVEEDLSACRCQEMREQIEASRLAGAVGTDQSVDRPALDRKIDAIDGDEAFELLGQAAGLEYGVVRHAYVWGKGVPRSSLFQCEARLSGPRRSLAMKFERLVALEAGRPTSA